MEEVRRCPRERPGPGPEAARVHSAPIGQEGAEPRAVGAGGDPTSTEAEVVGRATEVEFSFSAVDLVVGIMVDLERVRGFTRGQG